MASITFDQVLRACFVCHETGGWLAIQLQVGRCTEYFRTDRLAKLMRAGELHFTIGATRRGMACRLNSIIKDCIRDQGLAILNRGTIAGSLGFHYPAFDTREVPDATILRVLRRVEDEVKRIAGDNAPTIPRRQLIAAVCIDPASAGVSFSHVGTTKSKKAGPPQARGHQRE